MNVVVSGVGCISGIGFGVEEHLQAFANRQDGLGEITLFRSKLNVPVAEVKASNRALMRALGLNARNIFSRTALLAIAAAQQAFDDARLCVGGRLRVGLVSSSSVGGMDLSEQFYPHYAAGSRRARIRMVAAHDVGDHTEQIARHLHLTGFRTSISTACSSAANAIMLGAKMIEHDMLDAAIVGGADALCQFTLNGFNSLMILDAAPCRPFDQSRAGLNLGEGAGYIVLQSQKTLARSASVYCRLAGYGNANDAYHQTASSSQGEGAYCAMRKALERAGVEPEAVDYINAHGTGTPNNDLSESVAIKRLFGTTIPPFSSTKAFTGHTLGAAGGLEAVFAALSVQRGLLYPNLHFRTPITETELLPITDFSSKKQINTVLSNSFGFGGNNAALVFSNK